MTRRFAVFDAGNKGASLAVERGGVLLTTTSAGLSIARSCRSTIAHDEFSSDVEFILFGTAASIANKVSIGLCTADASMSAYIGSDGESIGYRPAEGQIHTGGGSVQSVAIAGLGAAIRVALAFGATPTAAWYVNGTLIGTEDLPAGMLGQAIYFAVSLGSDGDAGDIQIQANSGDGTNGSRQMEFPGSGFSGWWSAYALPEAARISTIDYLSHHDDDLPSVRWRGGITGGAGDRRGFNIWWWGTDRQVQGGVLQADYSDPDGALDQLLSPVFRDQPVTVTFVDHTDSLADATESQTWVFDRCEVDDDLRKSIVLRDVIALLEMPLQRRAFRPDVDPQAANRWMPTLIGVAGSIPVTLVDADVSSAPQPTYQIAGQDIEQVGKVREAGVPLSIGVPDYALLSGGQQLQLMATPDAGEITLDASRTGAGYIPPAPVDAIDGTGDPFAEDSGGEFADWDAFDDPADLPDSTPFPDSGDAVFPQNSNSHRTRITHKTYQLVIGQRYRWEFTVKAIQTMTTGLEAEIGLTYGTDRFTAYASVDSTDFWTGNPFGDPRTYSGTFECIATHFATVYYQGNQVVSGGINARLSGLTFIELPPLNDTGDDEIVEDALPKINLENAMRMIIEEHGGMAASVWNSNDAAAIDALGSAGGGTYFADQDTLREALERLMPGYTAGIYKGRDGTLRVMRMKLPEEEIGSDPTIVDGSTFLRDMIVRRDPGAGLTRQIGVRKNWRPLNDADVDTAQLNPTQRARLAREFRYVLSTGASFAPGYDHVDAAEPLETHLWMPADGQAEIDFAGRAYSIGRAFYASIDIGSVVLLTYDRYGMQAGIPVVVVEVVEDRINDVFESITFWGPAPYEEF
jgi:hypothetical protein